MNIFAITIWARLMRGNEVGIAKKKTLLFRNQEKVYTVLFMLVPSLLNQIDSGSNSYKGENI